MELPLYLNKQAALFMTPSNTPDQSEQHKHSACILHVKTRLISSGNMVQASKVPVVNIHPSADFDGCYDVIVIMYLPDYAKHVKLDEKYYPYLDKIKEVDTEAGPVKARKIGIYYDKPNYDDPKSKCEMYLYSIWEMQIRYKVTGESAGAIWVRYTIDDPETTKGPITTIEKP